MKTIIMIIIYILLLWWLPGCDEALPSNPIVVIGDTIYVFTLDTDCVDIDYWPWGGDVEVIRNYEDGGYKVEFSEEIGTTINKIIVTLPSGSVYVLPLIRFIGDDSIRYQFYFEWSGEDY